MKKNWIYKSLFYLSLAGLLTTGSLRADLSELLPEQLRTANNEVIERSALEGRIVGLYFSASWCPPCRAFTPSLVELRDAHNEVFEVILVGFDRSEIAHSRYMHSYNMRFPALGPGDRSAIAHLTKQLQIGDQIPLPMLIVLSPDGNIITRDAVSEVHINGEAAIKRWKEAADL